MSRYMGGEFLAFSEYDGFSLIENQKQKMLSAINSQPDDYILNVNKEEYVEHIVSEYSISPIVLLADEVSASTYEKMIPAEHHPQSYYVHGGKSYPKDVVKFHLPFEGDPQLLKVRASTYNSAPPRIQIEGNEIVFEIVNFGLSPEQIRNQSERTIQSIVQFNQYLTSDLNSFNLSIQQLASQAFDSRKDQLSKKNDLMASLGVPLRKSTSTPKTFSVPAKRTPVISKVTKPTVSEVGYKPEPSLDSSIYQEILKIIHDIGKQFERLPATYSGKGEEQLRDHMLMILEPNFEGSATGETFNKNGKTDILLRHEGNNVFIAELKFWRGKKVYLDTISQLLGYLTWRDSKAAVVIFSKNKELSSVLGTIEESTKEHANYLGHVSTQEAGWYHYRFHIDGDQNREVKLAVMVFHVPE